MNIEQGTGDGGQVTAQGKTRTKKNLSSWNRPFWPTALVLCLVLLFSLQSSFAEKDKDLRKHFGLIFGTAYGPDDRPLYGARIEIHPVGQKHPHWELLSDHQGEFAQRVPPGPADYVITGQAEIAAVQNGVAANKKKQKVKAEKTVHIQAEERQDVGLHLAE